MFPNIPNELLVALAAYAVIAVLTRLGVTLPFMVPTGKPDDPATPEDESKKPYTPLDGVNLDEVIQKAVLTVLAHVFKKAPADVHAKIEAALADGTPPAVK